MPRQNHHAALAVALAAALSGCSSLAPRPGDHDINALLAARHGPAVNWSQPSQPASEQNAVKEWMASPMTAHSAVRVAMLRSPKLQLEYARLGLARAEVLEAVQVANPRLSLAREYPRPGSGYNSIAGISLPLADLLTLPVRSRLAKAEFERAKFEIASTVLGVAADVEAAWYRHVGAQQVADMRVAIAEGAVASAELAQRFHDAGNISELQLKLEQAAASEARIAAAQARAEAARTRMQLNTLIGLSGDDADWRTSERLPMPVAQEDDPTVLAELAHTTNLELLAARSQASVLADALGITKNLRWIGGTEIGYGREKDSDGTHLRGPSLDIELPIFNQGQAKLARANAQLDEARARVAQAELATDNAIRLGVQEVRELASVVAMHRDGLIPQRETIVTRSQQEQNFMLIGVFELIQAKVKEYDAYQGYLQAVRDYWLARVELMRAVGQRLPSDASISQQTPSVQDILAPAKTQANDSMPGMDHSQHAMPIKPKADTVDPHAGHHMPAAQPQPPVDPHAGHRMPPTSPPVPAKAGDSTPIIDHSQHHMPPSPSPSPPKATKPEEKQDEQPQEKSTDDHAHQHGATP